MNPAFTTSGLLSAQELRRELSALNQPYARAHGLPFEHSRGEPPVVLYLPYADGSEPRHGNFLPASYTAILADAEWRKRLGKTHSQRRDLPRCEHGWKELDSSCSSDALLMNVFCYPRVFSDGRLAGLLGVEADARPQFGFAARVPLANGNRDTTEVDMRLGSLLVEAKLSETDFTCRPARYVERYRDLAEVFERRLLPLTHPVAREEGATRVGQPEYVSYQLIRNVLAAYAHQASFCVLVDARRPDLVEAWYAVMRAVRSAELRTRCKVLTWQELAGVLPPKVRDFLGEKYGIQV